MTRSLSGGFGQRHRQARPRLSVFAQGGYQCATDESGFNPYRGDSVMADIGVRFAW